MSRYFGEGITGAKETEMDNMNDRGHPKKKWSTAFRVLQTVNRFKQIPEKKEVKIL